MAAALNASPEKYISKGAKSVKARVGNISDYLPPETSLNDFWNRLRQTLTESGMEAAKLKPEEEAAVKKLKAEKYDTWDWNFGKSPKYSMSNKRRFSGGELEVRLTVTEGRLEQIGFYGDFLSRKDTEDIADELVGKKYSEEAVGETLNRFDIYDYFGGISHTEVLKTIFNYE